MKREDLKKIPGMTDEILQAVLDLHKIDAESWKEEKQGLNDQLKELDDKIAAYDGVDVKQLQDDLKAMRDKYDADMMKKDKEFAMQRLFDSYDFTSGYAKQAVMNDFEKAELKWENGAFLGAGDFFKNAMERDPGAFKSDGDNAPEGEKSSSGVSLKSSGSMKKTSGVEDIFYKLNPDLKPS